MGLDRRERRKPTSWSEEERIRVELGTGFRLIYMRESVGFEI